VIDLRDRRDFARLVPKAEIHLHLEGSVEVETLLRLARARGEPSGPDARSRFAAYYVHLDFLHFLAERAPDMLRDPQTRGPRLITSDLSHRLQEQNVRYAEVFCSPIIFRRSIACPRRST